MKQYLDVLKDILENGVVKPNRTGVDTRGVFGRTMRFDLSKGFPAVTTKKLAWHKMFAELVWFLMGESDVRKLHDLDCHIWDHDAFADDWLNKASGEGDAGRIYGVQWRNWRSAFFEKPVDQIAELVRKLKETPNDRRMVVSAWNPGELDMMCLPPCHMLFQVYVYDGKLSLAMIQRSCDMFLGVPFNIASYALITHLLAQVSGLKPGEFIHFLMDAHVYENHLAQVQEQLSREPKPLPTLWLNPAIRDLDSMAHSIYRKVTDGDGKNVSEVLDSYAHLENYNPWPTLKGELAGSKK